MANLNVNQNELNWLCDLLLRMDKVDLKEFKNKVFELKKEVNSGITSLDDLYKQTNFAEEVDHPKWGTIKISQDKDEDGMEYLYVHVPECTYFGETLICTAGVYENGGYDCLFIQELVRLYREGKLVVKGD